jgi:MFS family permease
MTDRAPKPAGRAKATLGTCAAAHFLHDGFSDSLYVLLPLLASEFRLSFAQVGLIRSAYLAGMTGFQIPGGILAERWGETRLLAGGTALVALGYLALGTVGSFGLLLIVLLLAGLGSGVQHPLSSSLVSRAYETGARRVALGTYNFSGDLGKVAVPALVATVSAWAGWRWATAGYGALGLLGALGVLVVLSRLGADGSDDVTIHDPGAPSLGWGIRDARGFQALSAIGIIDQSTRTGFLTFLPFLLLSKGSEVATVGLALTLVFAGGAAGKFACGALAERIGVIRTVVATELATGGGILLLLTLPLGPSLVLLPLLGIALNGTSSVLYGSVADLVMPERRSRAYGLFYTLGIGAGAVAPFLYGLLSDRAGVPVALTVVGLLVLTTIPLAQLLRAPAIADSARAR